METRSAESQPYAKENTATIMNVFTQICGVIIGSRPSQVWGQPNPSQLRCQARPMTIADAHVSRGWAHFIILLTGRAAGIAGYAHVAVYSHKQPATIPMWGFKSHSPL